MRDRVTADVNRSHAISGHAGIEWVEKFPDLMPGKLFFQCERLCASITRETCHQNFTAAHEKVTDETPLRLMKCRGCTVGRALHTGADDPRTWQDVRPGSECVRCGRHDLRIITTTKTCVSCWNRRRETERGSNARGRPQETPITLHLRRVGLVDADGNQTWRRFDAWHDGEAISRAIRQIDGAKFHDQQPGKSVWNQRIGRFQYRCGKHQGEFGTLRELVADDGATEYVCPVCKPGRASELPEARICSATSIQSKEFVRDMLVQTGNAVHLTEHFAPTAHVCEQCTHYAIEARLRNDRVETRCPLCDQ
ncbi:hypothetical protein ACRTIQ_004402 [Escherichia coli]